MPKEELVRFTRAVQHYYAQHQRDLPWRTPEKDGTFSPYKILVSEVMLQQTQVARVAPKYQLFLDHFPTIDRLATAPLSEVIRVWVGLGYNRRAKYLHDAVRQLIHTNQPWSIDDLRKCKGIGENTAAAVLVYSYDLPLVFIETNIRTVFIHHFFPAVHDVGDKEIIPLVAETLPVSSTREWYWALMDYGTYLKSNSGNASRQSKHYVRQSRFEGSTRQLRGQIIRTLSSTPFTLSKLEKTVGDARAKDIVRQLESEGLIVRSGKVWKLRSQ